MKANNYYTIHRDVLEKTRTAYTPLLQEKNTNVLTK